MVDKPEQIIPSTCNSHCGGACPINVHTRDGVITRITSAAGETQEARACARGRAYRQRVYAPDRLLYPLRRAGKRGDGKFERVSWDVALDETAVQINRVYKEYGPQAAIFLCSSGDISWLHNPGLIDRLLIQRGGYTGAWGQASAEAAWFAMMANYGTAFTGNTRDDLLRSNLIILWGWNPAVSVRFGNESEYLRQARDAGTRIVCVDPRYTDSAAAFAAQWIPIRPGTDAAMLLGMAQVIIDEDRLDAAFIARHTVGYDAFRDYVTGREDGLPRTPEWAAAITGVPAATIRELARAYADAGAAALCDGFGPGRTANGAQFHRAVITLAAITGNIGVPGGNAGGAAFGGGFPRLGHLGQRVADRMPGGANPVDASLPSRPDGAFYEEMERHGGVTASYYLGGPSRARVNRFRIADAILEGKRGGYPADYKLLYLANLNYVNQYANTNKIARALKALDFLVVQEQFMTATAKFADIILPTNTYLERNDITRGTAFYYGYMNRVIPPLGESRSHYEIAADLARRVGLDDFGARTEEDWLREIVRDGGLGEYETFKREGIFRVARDAPYVSFQAEIADPGHNPFPTPSRKIEIYSERIAAMENPALPPIPKYPPIAGNRRNEPDALYPLRLVTPHFIRRAHTQFENIPWLREAVTQTISLHPADAATRGIKDGDTVRVFNGNGQILIPARLTQRIMPGVADLPQGAWYAPDASGLDHGGCANVLTSDETSDCGGFVTNGIPVQIECCPD